MIPARLLVAALAATTTAGGFAINAATAQPAGGACTLHGQANFAPNGPGNRDTFGYSFGGDLTNCQSDAGTPASGHIGAGEQITESVLLTVPGPNGTTTTTQGTARYQEPAATGTGNVPGASCASGTTSGTSVVTWADGKTSVISYNTTSAGAGVELDGNIINSVAVNLVPGSESVAGASAPPTFTITSNEPTLPSGDSAGGVLAFEVADPTQCTTDLGVTSAGIDGAVAVGNPTG